MQKDSEATEQRQGAQYRLGQPFPNGVAPRNLRVFGKPAIALGISRIVQYIDDVRAANRLRIIDARLSKSKILAQLLGSLLGDVRHVVFRAELQAARGAGFDAGRLQALTDAIGAERALVDFLRGRIEFRNIEGASGNAEFAADAILLLEIDDAVGVLHDGAVGGTGAQASGIGAVHALVLAHEPL